MAGSKPKTYAQAQEAARAALAAARLNDPEEHFPYKHQAALDVLDADEPMGPGIPGGTEGRKDASRNVGDYMTRAIADASRDYVDAQAAYLRIPSDDTRRAYESARDQLVAARLDHRQARGDGFTIGAAARRAG